MIPHCTVLIGSVLSYIFLANRVSGNSDGDTVLSEFRRYLNPAQVLDLAERPPAAALQWAVLVAPEKINVLAAGGDGTVAWMLSTVHKLDLEVASTQQFASVH